jgi:ferrous iron transport protein A
MHGRNRPGDHPAWGSPSSAMPANGGQPRRRWRLGWKPAANADLRETCFPLPEARIEELVWVVSVRASRDLRDKLVSMGIHRGSELRVVMRGDDDSVLISIANTRLGLDGAMSRAIEVRSSGIETSPGTARRRTQLPPQAMVLPSDRSPDPAPSLTDPTPERLQHLPVGSRGRVEGFRDGSRSYRQKLLAMGLTPGTQFEVTRHAPMGDPVELRVRGFSLMLRKQEADMLMIAVTHHG